jgi:hypothetical protein
MGTTTNRFFVVYTDKAGLRLCILAKNGLREAATGCDGYGLPYLVYSSSTLSTALDRLEGATISTVSNDPGIPEFESPFL